MTGKQRIRDQMRELLRALPSEAAAAGGAAACRRIVRQREFTDARTVMIFLPMPGEIDARDVARAAWAAHKRVVAPKVRRGRRGLMDAIEIRSLEADLEVSGWGIPEPTSGEALDAGELDLIVVPALAFDRRGNRLGRGGGYYDRFLQRAGGGPLLCGLAFACQLLDELPTEPHDRTVDMLATDEEFLRFGRREN